MALIYRAIQSAIANKAGEKLWHLSLVKMRDVITTQVLAEHIAEKSSLSPGDVHNVIRNLMTTMRVHLLNSYTVKLEGLGSFTMIAHTRGQGVKTAKEVNPNQVTYLRCQFTPEYTQSAGSTRTRALIQGVKFTSVEQFKKMIIGGLDDGNNNDGNNNDGNNNDSGNNGGGDNGEAPDPAA